MPGTTPAALGLEALDPLLLGLCVALGGGLLIGLERERRKGRGPQRGAAGIRSFTLVTLAGALAQGLAPIAHPALVVVGAAAVVLLAALAYRRSLGLPNPDPGMTTELALVVSYLVGVLAMARPAFGAGAAVVLAVLLAARGRLHHFATRLLSEDELHDGLLLAALALVLVPLLPQAPVAWLGGLQPHQIAALVLLILGLQAAGHVALRLAGPQAGLALAGLMSGFVSSTATVAAMGARLRQTPALSAACTAGAMLSSAATWLQALLLLAALAPALALRLLPALAAGALVALGCGAWQAWRAHRQIGARSGSAAAPQAGGRALRVREALLVAALLTGVTLAVSFAQRQFGGAGALGSAALAGFGDAHAGIAALGSLQRQGLLEAPAAAAGVLLTVSSNSLTRVATAAFSGGAAYALRMAACLFGALGAAALTAWLGGALRA